MTTHFCYRCVHYQSIRLSDRHYSHACALNQPQFPLTIECSRFEIDPFWLKAEKEKTHDAD